MDVTALNLRSVASRERITGHPEMADILDLAADKIIALAAVVHSPLSSDELRLVDKNCDWVAFRHAWNAVMKSRLARLHG